MSTTQSQETKQNEPHPSPSYAEGRWGADGKTWTGSKGTGGPETKSNLGDDEEKVSYNECIESNHKDDDGNETSLQKVQKMRDNYKSKVGNYGEVLDNSIGWGKATICGVVVNTQETIIIDDGNFQELVHFRNLWRLKKNKNEKKYNNPANKNMIGKWNEGATSSAICMGNLHHAFTNSEGKLYKNTFDVSRYIRTNKFPSGLEEATQDEIADFLYYQRLLNPDYNLECKNGTMIRWGNLCKHNTQKIGRRFGEDPSNYHADIFVSGPIP